MSFWAGVIVFALGLTVSVVLHEAGHFVTARRYGMKATQFFVGFGPRIWSWRRGETEYGVKWILLGGYVKIEGMTPPMPGQRDPGPRAFFRGRPLHRLIVLASGSVINVVLGFVMFAVIAMSLGTQSPDHPTTTVASVSDCVPSVSAERETCGPDDPPAPAQDALRLGDRVLAFGGRPVETWRELAAAIQEARPGEHVELTVERDGERADVEVTMAAARDRPGAFLGITPRVAKGATDPVNPVRAIGFALDTTGRMLGAIKDVLVDLPAAIPRLFTPERASSPGGQAASIVGAGDISGQLFASDLSLSAKVWLLLMLLASINLFVGVLNLLPLLPLDGGHVAVLGYERLRALRARLRGAADPGPVDYAKLTPYAVLGLVLLIGLGVLLITADIVNPLKVLD